MNRVDKHVIELSPEHASLIDHVIAAGEFSSPDEVVEVALHEWRERRDNFGYTLEELRGLIQEGIDSGPPLDGPSSMEELKRKARLRTEASNHEIEPDRS